MLANANLISGSDIQKGRNKFGTEVNVNITYKCK